MLDLLERPKRREIETDPRLDRASLTELRRRGFSDDDIAKALASLRSPVSPPQKNER